MTQTEILKHLVNEVAQAIEEHKIAHTEFKAIMKEIPKGTPQPDGAQRLENASTACAYAREKERVSKARLQQFQAYGFIPKDLK